MHFRTILILGFFMLASTFGFSQSTTFGQNVIDQPKTDFGNEKLFQPKVNVSVGTSFTSFAGSSAFSTWVMPEITMPVSDRWSISVGMGYSGIYMNGVENIGFSNQNSQYAHLFVSGQYKLNQRVTLTGTAYKTMLLNPAPDQEFMQDGRLDFSSQGVMIDMNYKVTEQFQINVGFEYRQQNSPMYQGFSPGFNNMMPIDGFSQYPR